MPGNYRPISVLPILSKIFEKHVATHLYLYLSKYKLLHESQSGFRCKHSCHTALTNLIDRWLKYMDDGNLIGTVLDLKKAFDMVDHNLLCKKLQYYKISTDSMKWFESYLSLRTQNLCIGNNISNPEPVKYGVSQGSIIIFINDLPLENLTSEIDMYADDTTLSINGKNIFEIEATLNENLNYVNMRCTNNNMVINPTKTTCMLIGTKQRKAMMETEFNIYIGNENIQNVNIQKLLGIYLDHNLDWKNQIDYICKNISSRLFLFAKIKKIS